MPRRMPNEMGFVMADGFQFGFRKKSTIREHRIKRLNRMAFALHVTIARQAGKSLRRDVQDAVVEHVQNIEARKPPASVARARLENRFERFLAQTDGFNLQF